MTTENEQIEIELDDKTAAIAHILAEEKGISVDQYITELLTEAMENGYFDRPENVTIDDPLV
jgi:predicted DNA binding protein